MRLSSVEVVEKARVTECDASTTRTRRRRGKHWNDNKSEKREECESETKWYWIRATQENLEKAVSDEWCVLKSDKLLSDMCRITKEKLKNINVTLVNYQMKTPKSIAGETRQDHKTYILSRTKVKKVIHKWKNRKNTDLNDGCHPTFYFWEP